MNKTSDENIEWEAETREKYEQMIAKIPVFLRPIAKEKVGKKAVLNARDHKRAQVNEKDMVDAFFSETPFGFHGPMITDMEDLNIDYKQYGYPE